MGNYVEYFTFKMKQAYDAKDITKFRSAANNLITYINDYDRLMGTSEHLLLGSWIEGLRKFGKNDKERKLLEWNAKRQITDWGGNIKTYSIKEWSGYMNDYVLPQWKIYIDMLEESLLKDNEFDQNAFDSKLAKFKENWYCSRSKLSAKPQGNTVEINEYMWQKYGKNMIDYEKDLANQTAPGIAVGKPVKADSFEVNHKPEYAVDGHTNKNQGWWAVAPASLVVDLENEVTLFGFQVCTYWGDGRYYQYIIETSIDGQNWSTIVDMSQNTQQASSRGNLHKFKIAHPDGVPARYVRLNMLKNSANTSIHVSEFKIFDSEIGF